MEYKLELGKRFELRATKHASFAIGREKNDVIELVEKIERFEEPETYSFWLKKDKVRIEGNYIIIPGWMIDNLDGIIKKVAEEVY